MCEHSASVAFAWPWLDRGFKALSKTVPVPPRYQYFLIAMHSRVTFSPCAHTVLQFVFKAIPLSRLLNPRTGHTVAYLQRAKHWNDAAERVTAGLFLLSLTVGSGELFWSHAVHFGWFSANHHFPCPPKPCDYLLSNCICISAVTQQSIIICLTAFHRPKASEQSKPQVNVQHIQSASHPQHPPIHPCLSGLCSL